MSVRTTQLELGTRVRIVRSDAYHYGRYGVIDRIDTRGRTLYHVSDPYKRQKIEWWYAEDLVPDSGGKPEVDPAIVKIGKDLLLEGRRKRIAARLEAGR